MAKINRKPGESGTTAILPVSAKKQHLIVHQEGNTNVHACFSQLNILLNSFLYSWTEDNLIYFFFLCGSTTSFKIPLVK